MTKYRVTLQHITNHVKRSDELMQADNAETVIGYLRACTWEERADVFVEEDGMAARPAARWMDEQYFDVDIAGEQHLDQILAGEGTDNPAAITSAHITGAPHEDVGEITFYDADGAGIFSAEGRSQPHLTHCLLAHVFYQWPPQAGDEDFRDRPAPDMPAYASGDGPPEFYIDALDEFHDDIIDAMTAVDAAIAAGDLLPQNVEISEARRMVRTLDYRQANHERRIMNYYTGDPEQHPTHPDQIS